MTEVMFHFNVPHKLGYACRLLRKAHASGRPVSVLAPEPLLTELDGALWSFSALDFVPHCTDGAAPDVQARTPIVMAADTTHLPSNGVLLYLGDTVPVGFERFERLIELVGTDEVDRTQARQRWRHYADRGYAIQRHDVKASD